MSTVLKEIFSRFGIPEVVIADNMPFNSYSFREFAEQWNFKVITSSPYYPKANGLAEKYVGITKKMLESKCDLQLSLLDYRNSPVAGMQWSPAQLLLSKNLRTKLPTRLELLKPVVIEQAAEVMKENQLKQSKYYNQNCTFGNTEFNVNDKVLVRNVKNNIWEEGIIVEKLNFPPRSYLIRINNKIIRRKASFIKKYYHRNNDLDEVEPSTPNCRPVMNVKNGSQNQIRCRRSGRIIKPLVRLDL